MEVLFLACSSTHTHTLSHTHSHTHTHTHTTEGHTGGVVCVFVIRLSTAKQAGDHLSSDLFQVGREAS